MPEELTTRDVFQQVDVRLSRVEVDLRDFRMEVNGRFERVEDDFSNLRKEVNGRLDRLQGEMHTTFRWMVGLMLVSWLSLMASIWLK